MASGKKDRRTEKKGKSGESRPRLKAVVLGSAALCLCASLAVVTVVPTALDYRKASDEVENLKAEQAKVAAANASLEDEIAFLKTDEGVQSAAQDMGWTSEGEIAVKVTGTGLTKENQ